MILQCWSNKISREGRLPTTICNRYGFSGRPQLHGEQSNGDSFVGAPLMEKATDRFSTFRAAASRRSCRCSSALPSFPIVVCLRRSFLFHRRLSAMPAVSSGGRRRASSWRGRPVQTMAEAVGRRCGGRTPRARRVRPPDGAYAAARSGPPFGGPHLGGLRGFPPPPVHHCSRSARVDCAYLCTGDDAATPARSPASLLRAKPAREAATRVHCICTACVQNPRLRHAAAPFNGLTRLLHCRYSSVPGA